MSLKNLDLVRKTLLKNLDLVRKTPLENLDLVQIAVFVNKILLVFRLEKFEQSSIFSSQILENR